MPTKAEKENMNLHDYFDYKDGKIYRKNGNLAGNMLKNGYGLVSVKGKRIGIHRVIYAMHHGFMPEIVDHIDGNPSNNNIQNLRPATKSQNGMNQKLSAKNTSGYKGVSWNGHSWRVCVYKGGKKITVGTYKDKEVANVIAMLARTVHHNDFARHV
jgi:hypothetical protein